MKKFYYTLLLLSLLTTSAFVNAKLYKWTDDNGELHISDRPPLDYSKAKIKGKKKKQAAKKSTKPDKKIIAWRCKELEDQYESAMNKAMRFATDKSLAASMKSEAENYKNAMEQICG